MDSAERVRVAWPNRPEAILKDDDILGGVLLEIERLADAELPKSLRIVARLG